MSGEKGEQMMVRGRIRPSKPSSVLSMIIGAVFIVIGFAWAIPEFGGFGMLWTFVALGITVLSAINVFSSRGVAERVVEFDMPPQAEHAPSGGSVEERLRKLNELRGKGLLSEAEYQEQRKRIVTEL